jgi:hypothetical protein
MKTLNPNVALWRTNHHTALAKLFGRPASEGLAIWRKLNRLEHKANLAACERCNGTLTDAQWEALRVEVGAALRKIGKLPRGFFFNGDPRGYTLKVSPEVTAKFPGLQKDWGGYGCLAAQID